MEIPEFARKEDLFDFLHTNKTKLITAKKAEMKKADAVYCSQLPNIVDVNKADNLAGDDKGILNVSVVINTTNWLDSHYDVHIDGLWKKTLRENKMILFLQEHKMKFENIIADETQITAYTENTTFKELGIKIAGNTEALIFNANIVRDRNPYMFDQYKKGYVKNHSVGMQYVKLFLAINSDSYPEEKAVWDKYYPVIANKERADELGFFYAVTEAKLIEGSAVPLGSNIATPIISVSQTKKEPDNSTHKNEPSPDTLRNALRDTIKEMFN